MPLKMLFVVVAAAAAVVGFALPDPSAGKAEVRAASQLEMLDLAG